MKVENLVIKKEGNLIFLFFQVIKLMHHAGVKNPVFIR